MKKIKVWVVLRRILIVVIAFIIGIRVYVWNAESLVGNRMPMPFGYGAAIVLSGSMEPVLSVNDLIIAKETEEYTVGDMVVYQNGNSVVVHRVVAVEEETIQTRGDANNVEDAPIGREQIKGKVIACIPAAGYVVSFMKTPVGIVLVLALAVILMEFSYRKEREKDDEKLENIKAEIRKLRDEE